MSFQTVFEQLKKMSFRPGKGIDVHSTPQRASLVAQLVKNPPAIWETWVRTLGWEDPMEKGKVTPVFQGLHSSWG